MLHTIKYKCCLPFVFQAVELKNFLCYLLTDVFVLTEDFCLFLKTFFLRISLVELYFI